MPDKDTNGLSGYKSRSFNEKEYLKRIQQMREVFKDNQVEFAKRIGVPFKRWANYERGYPVPRQVAWMLWDICGVSVEWLWYGVPHNKPKFDQLLEEAAEHKRDQAAAQLDFDRAKALLDKTKAKGKRAKARVKK